MPRLSRASRSVIITSCWPARRDDDWAGRHNTRRWRTNCPRASHRVCVLLGQFPGRVGDFVAGVAHWVSPPGWADMPMRQQAADCSFRWLISLTVSFLKKGEDHRWLIFQQWCFYLFTRKGIHTIVLIIFDKYIYIYISLLLKVSWMDT